MSVYTDARSQPGRKLNTGTDDRELFMVEFGEMVLEAWEEGVQYEDLTFKKTIQSGKADAFPIIGRKREASEHSPGEIILGGTVEHNEVQVALDKMLVDSAFIAEVDELMSNYELSGPYARQLAESIATTYDRRIATLHIKASRVTAGARTRAALCRATTSTPTRRPMRPSWKKRPSRRWPTSRSVTSAVAPSPTACRMPRSSSSPATAVSKVAP